MPAYKSVYQIHNIRKRIARMKEIIRIEETVHAQSKFVNWSPAADRFLAEHIRDGLDFLCEKLGRTYGGVISRANHLGLPYTHLWIQHDGKKRRRRSRKS